MASNFSLLSTTLTQLQWLPFEIFITRFFYITCNIIFLPGKKNFPQFHFHRPWFSALAIVNLNRFPSFFVFSPSRVLINYQTIKTKLQNFFNEKKRFRCFIVFFGEEINISRRWIIDCCVKLKSFLWEKLTKIYEFLILCTSFEIQKYPATSHGDRFFSPHQIEIQLFFLFRS